VAIRTPNVALGDLRFDGGPARVTQKIANRAAFARAIAVVELQHQRVRFATVNARVVAYVGQELLDAFGVVSRRVALGVGNVRRSITPVMLAIPRVLALATERMASANCAVLEVELGL
jgi:hypothetical protein